MNFKLTSCVQWCTSVLTHVVTARWLPLQKIFDNAEVPFSVKKWQNNVSSICDGHGVSQHYGQWSFLLATMLPKSVQFWFERLWRRGSLSGNEDIMSYITREVS